MALADYAAPVPDEENPLLKMIHVHDGRVSTVWPGHAMMARLRAVQWRYPNEQFAYMAQRTVEEVCVQLARDAVKLTGCRQLALAGGVASNVKANRRIRLLPEVESVSVFPHMGDGGLAVGAAMAAAAVAATDAYDLSDLALGSEWDDETIGRAINAAKLSATRPSSMPDHVAELIARGAIVLWFQGRMEYGPRALGCRSVLARPDRIDIRDRLNLVLKQRVWYQPFCPSLLESDAAHILADYDGRPNRHMTMAYVVKPECRAAMAGVTSVDGSCRPQMIADDARGVFPDLLRAMKNRLGHGVVLNTSFNIHGEALVCSPDEAIDVYRRSGADALAIGPFVTSVV
jgi:carbamoyltransferase